MPMQSIPAHYDGSQVLFDEEINLRANTRLIVTVLSDTDSERIDFLRLSSTTLADAYSDDEIEYTEADLTK
jgi:hypothetical protein